MMPTPQESALDQILNSSQEHEKAKYLETALDREGLVNKQLAQKLKNMGAEV